MKLKVDISIEPVIFLVSVSIGICTSGQVNLILNKICGHESDVNINKNSCLQQSTDISTLKAMLKECLPIIPLLLAGRWRDKNGKNLPILWLTIIGQILGAFTMLLSSIFWNEFNILETIIIEAIVTGLTGSFALQVMTATCFISARTSVEDRTFRVSLLLAAYLSGVTIGLIMAGVILQNIGYIPLFLMAVMLPLASLIYLHIFVHEKTEPSKKSLPLWQTIRVLVKKRENNNRPLVLLMLVVHCIFGTLLLCEANVFLFFLQENLNLSVTEAGFYTSYRSIILSLSTFIVIPVLSKYFKIHDISLGIMSSLLSCLSAIWSSFARTKLQLTLCPLAELLRGGVYAVEKSIMTKCVGPSEIGQILSAEYVIEAVCHLLILPLYTYVYNKTNRIYPGAFFLLTAIFSMITLIIFCIAKFLTRTKSKQAKLDEIPDQYATHL